MVLFSTDIDKQQYLHRYKDGEELPFIPDGLLSSSPHHLHWTPPLPTRKDMATWLQAGTLLFLLALSTGENAATPQHLCGAHLVDALYLVCGPSGFFYAPNPKREVDPLLGFLPPKAAQDGELTEYPYKEHIELMVKRGIVEQCCHKPCSIFDLQNYCN